MTAAYPVPQATLEREIVIKKSRFIARAGAADSREAALAFVVGVQRDYPDANHHCWAYLVGNPATAASAAMHDDSEPSGTAGKPILNVIQHKGIGDVVVVVSRYFGGVKLGAGGLVRAYAGATQAVLAELPVATLEPRVQVTLQMSFAQEQPLRHWAEANNALVQAVEYTQNVIVTLSLRETDLSALEAFCAAQQIHVLAIKD